MCLMCYMGYYNIGIWVKCVIHRWIKIIIYLFMYIGLYRITVLKVFLKTFFLPNRHINKTHKTHKTHFLENGTN